MKPTYLLAIAAVALVSGRVPAAASDFLDGIAGEWRGQGTYVATGSAAKRERLTCRMSATLTGPSTLKMRGRCATPGSNRALGATLVDGGGGKVSGTLDVAGLDGDERSIDGSIKGALLSLDGESRRGAHGLDVQTAGSDRLGIRLRSTNGTKSETVEISFARQ